MEKPAITTAIPKRRYQYGDYQAIVLGDIRSSDGRDYRYILAMVREGENQPLLYVSAERTGNSFLMRVISELFSDDLEQNPEYGELDSFSKQALDVASQVLGLGDVMPVKVM